MMIFGSYHQGGTIFAKCSRGSKCTCIALAMLIKFKEGFSFSSKFLDQILITGDQIYKTVIESLQKEKNISSQCFKL